MLRITIILAWLAVLGCSQKKEEIPPLPTMNKLSGKIILYQVMTRLFGNTVTANIPYGTLPENGVGKFSDINDQALLSLKTLGITHMWYTGVIEHALLTDYTHYGIPLDDADVVKGRAGSPYAIKDYYDVNPDLADDVNNRMKEFESLVKRTHAHDLKVIIDFVPNHVARSYTSDAKPKGVRDLGEDDDKTVQFKASNNFYYLPGKSFVVPNDYVPLGPENQFPTKNGKFDETPAKVTGNDKFAASPDINDWFETVKLNYGVDIENGKQTHFDPVPDTWIKMKDILIFWTKKNIDGFRCDMAEMVPVEFWSWAIPQIKAVNPDILFIAEIYNPAQYENYIHNGKFDYLYDKVGLYDVLRALVQGNRSVKDILANQKKLEKINARMLHFLENHDEQRIASQYFAGNPWKAVPAMVISATVDQGPVMIYFGQEVAEPGAGVAGFSGDDGRTTLFDYWGVPEHQKWMNGGKFDGDSLSDDQRNLRKFYSSILNLAATNEAIVSGSYHDLTGYNIEKKNIGDDVYAYLRISGNEKLLIIAGFNTQQSRIKISIPSSIAEKILLSEDKELPLAELLWGQLHETLTDFSLELELPAYSAYIFKIN